MNRPLAALAAAAAAAGCADVRTLGSIERRDAALDAILAPDAAMEILAEGFDWTEGPLWIADGGYLIFSDIPPNKVMKWKEGEGVSVYLAQSGYLGPIPRPNHIAPDEPGSNGLLLDPQGRLLLCQHGDRRVARMEAPLSRPEPRYASVADRFEGKRFNSPNDACFHPNGDLYFTDPPYGLTRKEGDPTRELDFQGVYRAGKDGKVTLLTKEMSRPNGIAFSPDARTLYVANSDPKRAVWMAFDVKADGTLGPGRLFYDATGSVGKEKGLPDGLKVDRRGNLLATGPGGVWIFNAQGKVLGRLLTGQATSNCAFGEGGRSLFITADMFLVRVRLQPGA
jgi:gluconolactonase